MSEDGQPDAFALSLGVSDDGDTLTWSISSPAHGSASVTDGAVSYTPDANYNGPDSFTVTVSDGDASDSLNVNVTVEAVNDAPVAKGQTGENAVKTDEDTEVNITLTATDVDEGDTLTYEVVTQPGHGTLAGTAPNLTYTPAANYSGPDAFAFTVSDGAATSAPATVSITVSPVNDAPSVAEIPDQSVNEDAAFSLDIKTNFGDVDEGDTLSYSAALAGGGTLPGWLGFENGSFSERQLQRHARQRRY